MISKKVLFHYSSDAPATELDNYVRGQTFLFTVMSSEPTRCRQVYIWWQTIPYCTTAAAKSVRWSKSAI